MSSWFETLLANISSWFETLLANIKQDVVYDDKVDNWFLMPHWFPVIAIVVAYLLFVKIIGPNMMKDRNPVDIKNILLVYNFVQTIYNAYIVSYLFLPGLIPYLFHHSCFPLPKQGNPLWPHFMVASYLYFLSKIIDLLDTIFFVIRKKQNQVTFLHVYHHAMMVIACWAYLRYFKGEQGVFIGLLNSLVHVVMYSYYFLAACGPEIQKYLWWKKYITKFQLVQFILFGIHQMSLIVFSCDMPVALTWFILSQAIIMFILFGHFYIQTYTKKKSSGENKSSEKTAKEEI